MTDQPKKRIGLRTSTIILSVLLLAVAGFGAYSFHAWRRAVADNPVTTQNGITKAVNSIVVTPHETPQIATVKNAAKLTASLSRIVNNGDVLLIYNKADRIIVYRPAVHKIVDMLTVQSPTPASAAKVTSKTP